MDGMGRQNEMKKKIVYVDGDMDIFMTCVREKIEFSCSNNEWKLKKEEENCGIEK